jgi:hypothetical protein
LSHKVTVFRAVVLAMLIKNGRFYRAKKSPVETRLLSDIF